MGLRAMGVPLNLSLTFLKAWLCSLKLRKWGKHLKNAHFHKETSGDLKVPGNEEKPKVDLGQGGKPGITAGGKKTDLQG